jgi:5-hydroxyisourate hydrolase-like protein (transthyretin family)
MAFNIKQNDTSPSLQATLKDAALTAIDLTGATVRFHMKSIDGTVKVDKVMTIVNEANGVVQYNWVTGDTDTVGTYYVEFEVTYADASIETFPNNGNRVVSVVRELN